MQFSYGFFTALRFLGGVLGACRVRGLSGESGECWKSTLRGRTDAIARALGDAEGAESTKPSSSSVGRAARHGKQRVDPDDVQNRPRQARQHTMRRTTGVGAGARGGRQDERRSRDLRAISLGLTCLPAVSICLFSPRSSSESSFERKLKTKIETAGSVKNKNKSLWRLMFPCFADPPNPETFRVESLRIKAVSNS